jgi:hypothetical protein
MPYKHKNNRTLVNPGLDVAHAVLPLSRLTGSTSLSKVKRGQDR